MVVLCLTNCPLQLRGDLTKWMSEVNTGVYVGRLSARVREELWERVRQNIKNGQAIMAYSCNNEQGYSFLTHNTTFMPVDYEGITLIKRISCEPDGSSVPGTPELRKGFSKASKYNRAARRGKRSAEYVVLDVETTGLDPDNSSVIEIGMLKVVQGAPEAERHCLVKGGCAIPSEIEQLTGITEEMVEREGVLKEEAYQMLKDFIGSREVIGYNLQFDMRHLERLAEDLGETLFITKCRDVLDIARRKIRQIRDYKMKTVAEFFSLDSSGIHRAPRDCELIYRIYEELNKM